MSVSVNFCSLIIFWSLLCQLSIKTTLSTYWKFVSLQTPKRQGYQEDGLHKISVAKELE